MKLVFSILLSALLLLSQKQILGYECQPCNLCDEFYVTCDYLYWKGQQDALLYGLQVKQIGMGEAASSTAGLDEIGQKFRWSSGFKLGIGYEANASCMPFDFFLNWTRFHQKATSGVAANEPNGLVITLLTGWLDNPDTSHATSATSQWNLNFDTIDFEIGKCFAWCSPLFIRPHIGIKGAIIKQKQTVIPIGVLDQDRTVPVNVTIERKNDFKAIGPRLGVDSKWNFTQCWGLFGNISGSLLYGRFHFDDQFFFDEPGFFTNAPFIQNHVSRLRPTAQFLLGLCWNGIICGRHCLELHVAYEAQYWWNQWEHTTSIPAVIIGFPSQGDLSLQGLTVGGGFNF